MKQAHVIVCMTYGALPSKLFLPTEQVLREGVRITREIPGSFLVCLSEHHPNLHVTAEEGWSCRRRLIPALQPHAFAVVPNTVSEPDKIFQCLVDHEISPSSFTLVCDASHALRVKYIWKKLCLKQGVSLETVRCTWTKEQPYASQRGPIRWFLANVIALFLMKIFGIERFKNLKQSS